MSDSAESPSSSNGSPPTEGDQNSTATDTESPPSDSSPTKGSSPHSTRKDPSPPKSSPSPPSDSNSSPPDPSPPSDSDTSQPPDSESSHPNPPGGSNSSPPSDSNSTQSSLPSESDSSPPEGSPSSNSPPDSSASQPPATPKHSSSLPSAIPPTSRTSHNSPPDESLPPPATPNGSPSTTASGKPEPSIPVQTDSPPETPQLSDSPPAPTGSNPTPKNEDTSSSPSVLTPPDSRTSNHPKITSPSTKSDTDFSISVSSSPPSKSSGSSGGVSVAGATVAGVALIAFVAFFFVVLRRRKRRKQSFITHYRPPPNSFSVKTDGYYHGQQQHHTMGVANHSHEYYSGKPPPSAIGNSYGSYRGNALNSGTPESGTLGSSKSCFSYEEMMEITNGFSQQNVIGEGGFGSVYKGWLPDGRVVAVKQLKAGSGQGEREFRAEVEIISRVHHRHLVSLVGYCIAEHHRLLVYEFVPNNNLEHHLHGKGVPVIEWSKRLKIAVGAARGLAYLHEDCHPKIIHRDIKSANILLDDVFEAQVADFGLAKLSNDTHTHVSTRVMGTFGYMAPEYASSGKLTDRSDVFSFGVVLLELVTGRKPVDPTEPLGDESLVEWARPLLIRALENGDLTDLTDPRLEKRYVESEMFRMIEAAAACVRHSAPKRPRMVQVLRALDTEGDMPDLSNGIKFGQSTIFESDQSNAEMQRFRRMAFGSDDSSEYDIHSGEFRSREIPIRPPSSQKPEYSGPLEFPSGESETRPMNPRGFSQKGIF